jgi:hypothetical protein
MADADRDRILATLMEEWSPLQRDLMDWLEYDLRLEFRDFRLPESENVGLMSEV